MTIDFRASQVQTNKIITSGSTGTGAKLLVYDISAQDTSSPNQGIIDPALFDTTGIGEDIFLFVSGTLSTGSSTDRNTAFGGTVLLSGNLGFRNSQSPPARAYLALDSGGDLFLFDSNNPNGWTLTQLAESGSAGGSGENFWTVSSSFITTSSSIAFKAPNSTLEYTGSLIVAPISSSLMNTRPGGLRLYGGDGVSGSATIAGGAIEIFTGTGSYGLGGTAGGTGGDFLIAGGQGGTSVTGLGGRGANITITAGSGGLSTNTGGGVGGNILMIAGAAGTGFGDRAGGGFSQIAGNATITGGGGNARGGGFIFRLGTGTSATALAGRDGDFIVSGAGTNSARVAFERIQKVSFGVLDGITSTLTGGTDTFFFISGAIGRKNSVLGKTFVVGGDTVISGGLFVGSGTYTTGSDVKNFISGAVNQSLNAGQWTVLHDTAVSGTIAFKSSSLIGGLQGILFNSNTQYIAYNYNSGDMSFRDANTGPHTLTELAAGGGGGTSDFITQTTSSADATPQQIWSYTFGGTGSEKVIDIDATIIAAGTGSGITKRFKRNIALFAYPSAEVMENTIFAPIPDVSGSSAAAALDVGFITNGLSLEVWVTGSSAQNINWTLKAHVVSSSAAT